MAPTVRTASPARNTLSLKGKHAPTRMIHQEFVPTSAYTQLTQGAGDAGASSLVVRSVHTTLRRRKRKRSFSAPLLHMRSAPGGLARPRQLLPMQRQQRGSWWRGVG
jgi:hypothetical protein